MEDSAIFENNNEFKPKPIHRRRRWSNPEEMVAYLDLIEENCQQLSYLKRNLALYYRMSAKMASLGFRRAPLELRKKFSNIICRYKQEKIQNTGWTYFRRVHQILSKMKKVDYTDVPDKEEDAQDSSPMKSKNEFQKILFITPGTNNVCIDEADVETILKAMNGEDVTVKNDESQSVELIQSSVISVQENVNNSCNMEEDDSESRCNGVNSDTLNQCAKKTDTPKCSSQIHDASGEYSRSALTKKRKFGDQEPQIRAEKNLSVTKKPAQQIEPSKNCNCRKDEIDLYAALLATKLRNLHEKTRHIAMNKIDNILFKMKLEQLEDQQHLQNHDTQFKSSSSTSVFLE